MHRLPAAVLPVVDRLKAMPARTPLDLAESLAAFERALAAGEHHTFADAGLAARMAAGCRQLLADAGNHAPERLRLVQVAVDYLVPSDDACRHVIALGVRRKLTPSSHELESQHAHPFAPPPARHRNR